jgi:xylulokinase
MLRSVLEGISLNDRWLLLYVEKMIARKLDSLNFIGGGANSAIWSQIMADVLNRPIRQVKDPLTANSRGTAMLALMSLGMMDTEQAAAAVEISNTYEPNAANTGLYDEMFGRFVEIYTKNKAIWAKLNR